MVFYAQSTSAVISGRCDDNNNRELLYIALIWSTQSHCDLQHCPAFSTLSEKNVKGNMFNKVILYDNNIWAIMYFDYIGWMFEFTDNPLTRYVNMFSVIADAAYQSDNNICSALKCELRVENRSQSEQVKLTTEHCSLRTT